MGNISMITRLGLIITTAGALTVGIRYSSNFDNIQDAINTLKDRGVAYYNMATTSKEELKELQSKYDNLNAIYLGVLDKLALEEGATIEEIKTKIDSMVSEGNTDTLNTIGALIGLNAPVTADNVTEALNSMNEQLTTLETKVSTLEAELAQARADLTQANSEQEEITALLEACMAQVPAIEEEPGEEPGTTVDPVEPTLESVQAELNSIWSQFSTLVAGDSSKFTPGRVTKIQEGLFTLDNTDGYKVIVHNGSDITLEATEQIYNLLSQYKEKLNLYNSLLAQQ